MFKYLLSEEDFRLLIYELGYEIDMLDGKLNVVNLDKILGEIGFPNNWRDINEA